MKHLYTIALLLLLSVTAHAQPGSLNTGFSGDGFDIRDLSAKNTGAEYPAKMLLQADGKKLVVFENNLYNVMVARYNPDGTLDASYGDGGFSQPVGDIGFLGLSFAQQPDGKVVVVGSDNGAILWDFYIVRLNTDGSIDETFGDDGTVRYDFGFDDEASSILIQPDGKIIAGGVTTVNNQTYFATVRLNTDGTVDNTYGFSGRYVTVAFEGAEMLDMEFLPDGKIAVLGYPGGGYHVLLARYAANGVIDNTFSTDGYVEYDLTADSDFAGINALSIQPDGKWVVGGSIFNGVNYDFLVARYLSTGSPDLTFHGDGMNSAHIGGTETGNDIAIQADGKIVIGGYSNSTLSNFALARFTATGDLDGTFGLQGTELTSFSNLGYSGSNIISIGIQGDGRIVAMGILGKESQSFVTDIGLAIYTSAGQLESRHVSYIVENGYAVFRDAAMRADGKIVLAGYVWNGIDYDFLLGRYLPDGTPDALFGTNGFTITDFGGNNLSPSSSEYAKDLVIQPDGKIIAVGSFYGSNESSFAIARYNSDGTLDNTFHSDGKATIDVPGIFDDADAVALQADGKILVGGNSLNVDLNDDFDYALVRLNTDGSPDISFDGDGFVRNHWGYQDQIYSLAVLSDGKILAAGNTSQPNSLSLDFNIVRYNPDGSLDLSFGTNGRQATDFSGSADFGDEVAVQPDGKIIVTGSVINTGNLSYDFGVARYNADGTPDLNFGDQGRQMIDFGGSDYTFSLNMQADGKFFVTGYTQEQSDIIFDESTEKDIAIVKFNADGTLNGCFGDRGKVISDPAGFERVYGSAVHNDVLYVAGSLQDYNSFLQISKYSALIAAFNLTGGATSISCPPGGVFSANTDAGHCYATITDPLIDPLLCPEDATGTVEYVISRDNVVIESGTGSVSGKQFPKGNTTVTYSVSGQPSLTCTFVITVTDTELPTLVCPAPQNIDIGTNPGCMGFMPDFRSQAVVTDNCTEAANIVITQTPLPGEPLFNYGPLEVTFTATDEDGNAAAPCSVIMLKVDLSGPHVDYCPDTIVRNVTPGRCDAMVSIAQLGPPIVFDYCGGPVISSNNIPDGSIYPVGHTTVNWTYEDPRGNVSYCTQVVTIIDDEPPVITNESASTYILSPSNHTMRNVYIGYTATDNCSVTTSLSVSSNEPVNGVGDGDTDPDWIVTDNHNILLRAERSAVGNGRIYTITITATDPYGNVTTKEVEVRVPHNIKNPRSGQPFAVNSTVNFQGEFWDRPGNRHTSRWLIDGSAIASGTVTEPTATQDGKVTGSYRFTAPGVYKLQMNVTDQNGITHYTNSNGDLDAIVVIYDPNGGYAYGGGWFQSLPGALNNSQATGMASYGFAVNYRNAAKPKGETQFQFRVGNFEFNALNFDYLVVAGAKAQFRGTGKIINGQSGVSFIMTVTDGRLDGSNVDKIRLKIFKGSVVYYDNQRGASDAANPVQAVAENSIIYVDGTPPIAANRGVPTDKVTVETLTVNAFPNPADDLFNVSIQSDNKKDMIMLQVTDQSGRILFTRNTRDGKVIRFGEDLAPGMYYLNVVQGNKRSQAKLIKL